MCGYCVDYEWFVVDFVGRGGGCCVGYLVLGVFVW